MAVTEVSATNRTGRLQDRKAGQSRMPNWTIRFPPKATTTSGQQHEQRVPKVVSSVDGLGGNQDQTWPRSETSTDDEAKHSTKKGPEEIAEKQNKAASKETKIKAKTMASSQQQPKWTVQFDKPNHPISLGL
jgi:hypothetical protein